MTLDCYSVMFLVFRIFRNCVTKNPSNLLSIIRNDRNDILNCLKNFNTFYANYANLAISKNHIRGIECMKNTYFLKILQKYCQINITFRFSDINNLAQEKKIDETSVIDSMGKSLSRRRRRRTKLLAKPILKSTKKRPSKRKRASKKKQMNNYWLNCPAGSQFPSFHNFVFDSIQSLGNPNLNYQAVPHFPPLNPNLVFNDIPPSADRFSHQETKSYSEVVKTVTLLQSEGTDLNQFLAEARQDVYTPYGEWIKEGWRKDEARGDFIKVLSYNILSQNLLEMHPHLYKNHDEKYLDWEYRKEALLKEFREFDADVLCLQEVEGKETEFFNTNLEALGYKGIYKKRTNDKEDGCAIYYRVEKFDLKEYATVEYYQPGIQLLNRDNIGLIARLSPKKNPDKNIVFANTHLLFNPNRHDIKLAQVQILLAEIDRVAYRSAINNENRYTPYHPVILVGDFNLKPFTHVYKFLVSGYLEDIQCTSRNRRYSDFANHNQLMPVHLGITDGCQHYEVVKNRVQSRTEISDFKFVRLFNSDRKSLSFNDERLERKERMNYRHFGSGCLYHNLNLSSVYPHDHLRGNNATTFQDDWCNVDYIFYGPGRARNGSKQDGELKLVSYLRLPTKEEAEVLKAIPNEACASDHLPLLATFFLPSV